MGPRRGRMWFWTAVGLVLVVAAVLGAVRLGGSPGPVEPLPDPAAATEMGGQALAAEPSSAGLPGARRYVVVSSESRARYRVRETFFNVNREALAVGVTGAVTGEFSLEPGSGTASGVIRADISQLTSDEPRRDRAIRDRWLESGRFPTAEFRPTAIELGDSLQEGREIPVTVRGQLTVRDVTRPVAWRGTLVLSEESLRATLSTQIRMTDFGFEPPSILGMLRAEDEATLEVELVARPAATAGQS